MRSRNQKKENVAFLDDSHAGRSGSNFGRGSKHRSVKFARGPLGTEDGHPLHEGKQDAPPMTSTSGFSITRNWGDEVTNLTKRNVGEVINVLKLDGGGIYNSSIVRLRRRVDLPSESPDEQEKPLLRIPPGTAKRGKQITVAAAAPSPRAVINTPTEATQRGARKRRRS